MRRVMPRVWRLLAWLAGTREFGVMMRSVDRWKRTATIPSRAK